MEESSFDQSIPVHEDFLKLATRIEGKSATILALDSVYIIVKDIKLYLFTCKPLKNL